MRYIGGTKEATQLLEKIEREGVYRPSGFCTGQAAKAYASAGVFIFSA